jgi:3-isopropylmalate/(R)-2-methylmalate dehydratase small subunit
MDAVSTITGVGVPFAYANVDTDQIIPAEFLKRVTKTGYDDALFFRWRQDPDFILNQPAYRGATVLVAGPDFGTGSSREHAVWALRDFGIRAVLSPRFGDIFRGNAGKQGLVTAMLEPAQIEEIQASLAAAPGTELTVDLVAREVRLDAAVYAFQIDDYTRWRLLEGLDDIGLTLRNEDAIAAFETRRPTWLPATV